MPGELGITLSTDVACRNEIRLNKSPWQRVIFIVRVSSGTMLEVFGGLSVRRFHSARRRDGRGFSAGRGWTT